MAKHILTGFLVIALLILGAGLYLGHNGVAKLESSYSEALNKQTSMTKKLQEDNKKLEDELKKAINDKSSVEAELKKQNEMVANLLKQAQDAMVMEEQVKALNEKMQKTVESCQIRPKPIKTAVTKKVVVAPPAPKVEERIIIREVEKPSKPQTIVINKIFIKEGNKQPKLIKQDQKVLPDAYPNDLLK